MERPVNIILMVVKADYDDFLSDFLWNFTSMCRQSWTNLTRSVLPKPKTL